MTLLVACQKPIVVTNLFNADDSLHPPNAAVEAVPDEEALHVEAPDEEVPVWQVPVA